MKIVNIQNDKPTVTSLVVSEGVERSHKAIIQIIRRYENDISDFGFITFKMAKKKETKHEPT